MLCCMYAGQSWNVTLIRRLQLKMNQFVPAHVFSAPKIFPCEDSITFWKSLVSWRRRSSTVNMYYVWLLWLAQCVCSSLSAEIRGDTRCYSNPGPQGWADTMSVICEVGTINITLLVMGTAHCMRQDCCNASVDCEVELSKLDSSHTLATLTRCVGYRNCTIYPPSTNLAETIVCNTGGTGRPYNYYRMEYICEDQDDPTQTTLMTTEGSSTSTQKFSYTTYTSSVSSSSPPTSSVGDNTLVPAASSATVYPELDKSGESSGSLGIYVGVPIAAACLIAFVIILVAIIARRKKSGDAPSLTLVSKSKPNVYSTGPTFNTNRVSENSQEMGVCRSDLASYPFTGPQIEDSREPRHTNVIQPSAPPADLVLSSELEYDEPPNPYALVQKKAPTNGGDLVVQENPTYESGPMRNEQQQRAKCPGKVQQIQECEDEITVLENSQYAEIPGRES